ncbi:MAG: hypothetical protein ACYDDS_09260 [Candidatus Sulfotelmatobacter sp.]
MTVAEIREQLFSEQADQECLALPHPQWCRRGLVLAQEHRIAQFKVADWIVEGIELVGATLAYDFAEAVFPQYARVTFQSWVTVAKHFSIQNRLESAWLTFGHYQVAQGAERDPWAKDPNSKFQVAQEMVWLRKADERRMSVSALRYAIANAFELRKESFFNENPDARPKPSEPEPKPEPKLLEKNCYGGELKELKTPWLPKRARFHLDELARARRITTEQLLNRVIQDFLDAHCDEIGDVEAAAKKRQAEVFAQMDAAEAVEKLKREQRANERVEKAAREQQNAEIWAVLEAASG